MTEPSKLPDQAAVTDSIKAPGQEVVTEGMKTVNELAKKLTNEILIFLSVYLILLVILTILGKPNEKLNIVFYFVPILAVISYLYLESKKFEDNDKIRDQAYKLRESDSGSNKIDIDNAEIVVARLIESNINLTPDQIKAIRAIVNIRNAKNVDARAAVLNASELSQNIEKLPEKTRINLASLVSDIEKLDDKDSDIMGIVMKNIGTIPKEKLPDLKNAVIKLL
ncbi:MAG: hypothetical protein HCA25_14285 [Dolichospermum sp. DET50]|nr:hypothetical protein [Dolichospermum sp. DET66]MBS3033406.1 hypothetical protein [Dolichospermum sp. DET67]MBS3038610.1 hypothetical protein [Dolichospermum sp. DET50]QSX65892.1 MAG: hypothetical protein EZY12_13535 [Dolichospermum sp. DET69]